MVIFSKDCYIGFSTHNSSFGLNLSEQPLDLVIISSIFINQKNSFNQILCSTEPLLSR